MSCQIEYAKGLVLSFFNFKIVMLLKNLYFDISLLE